MKRNSVKKTLVIALTFVSLFGTNVFAKTFNEKPKAPPEENEAISNPGGGGSSDKGSKGGGGSKTAPGKAKKGSNEANKPGSVNNPYIRKISPSGYIQFDTDIKPVFNRLAGGEGNTKVTAYDFTKTNGKSQVTKILDDGGKEIYTKWIYPVVTVTRTTNKKIKETSRKNDFFEWQTSGPENWTKKTDSNRLTHTFTKVGKYKIVYTPHQLVTTSHQNFTGTRAVAYYPADGSSTTLLTKDTAGKLTTKTEGVWRTDYRKVWEFEITAPDVGKPVEIGPDKPPRTEIVNEETHPELFETETQLIH